MLTTLQEWVLTESESTAACDVGRSAIYTCSILDQTWIDQCEATILYIDNNGVHNITNLQQPNEN